jgi:hypothetical protein
MKQYFKDFVHNVFVHPLMMFMPKHAATQFHDWNARWAFREYYDEMKHEGKTENNES